MNEALQGKLSEILELGKQGVLQAADMIKEQMPDLVEQILRWEFVISLLWFVGAFILFVVMISNFRKLRIYLKKQDEDSQNENVEALIIPYALAHLIPLVTIFSSIVWIKILVAPKLFLVEYISQLIK